MADKDASKEARAGWMLARRLSVVYGLATMVGFFYASAYFGHFGINILNFIAPIDLLFISLEHIDRVALIAIVLMPIALISLVVGVPATVLLALSIVMILAIIAVAILLALFAFLIFLITTLLKFVRVPAIRLFWLKKAIYTIHEERIERAKAIESKDTTHDPENVERKQALTLAAAYRRAKSEGRPRWQLDPKDILEKAKAILDLVPKAWQWATDVLQAIWRGVKSAKEWMKESYIGMTIVPVNEQDIINGERESQVAGRDRVRLKPWDELHWPQRFTAIGLGLLLLAILIAAATRVGDVDAAILEDNALNCQLDVLDRKFDLACFGRRVILPTMERQASAKDRLRRTLDSKGSKEVVYPVYSIPNTNLASLEFYNCGGLNEGRPRQYARLHFRHDAGDDARRNTPDCLVYLGATGSMQFLAQLDSGSKAKRKQLGSDQTVVVAYPPTSGIVIVGDGATNEVVVGAGDCKVMAIVGPFESGSSALDKHVSDSCSTSRELELCALAGRPLPSTDALEDWIANFGDRTRRWPERLVLIGRVDSLPIYTENYRSNFALAQARANWVSEQFAGADWARNAHVMSVPGGPANHKAPDPCDRIVEVHMCWADRGDGPADPRETLSMEGTVNSVLHESNGDGA